MQKFAMGGASLRCYSLAMGGADWVDFEIGAVVADYFSMLKKELARESYDKTAHRRLLMQIIDRSNGAIEFKHQNISAVLLGLGHPWIDGYKPASNFQAALEDGVLRHLHAFPQWIDDPRRSDLTHSKFSWDRPLWIGPPPTHSNLPPAVDLQKMSGLASKYDVAERDARNRALGNAGELCVFEHERSLLHSVGRADLADRVIWTARDEGDGAGFDIASFEPSGQPRLIEVKTTNGWERTPFHLSRNELRIANANRDIWHLVRLWNFAREPRAYSLRPPLESHVELTPTSFVAQLN